METQMTFICLIREIYRYHEDRYSLLSQHLVEVVCWQPSWALVWHAEEHMVHFITYRRPARLTGFQENVFYHEVAPFDYPLFEFKPTIRPDK